VGCLAHTGRDSGLVSPVGAHMIKASERKSELQDGHHMQKSGEITERSYLDTLEIEEFDPSQFIKDSPKFKPNVKSLAPYISTTEKNVCSDADLSATQDNTNKNKCGNVDKYFGIEPQLKWSGCSSDVELKGRSENIEINEWGKCQNEDDTSRRPNKRLKSPKHDGNDGPGHESTFKPNKEKPWAEASTKQEHESLEPHKKKNMNQGRESKPLSSGDNETESGGSSSDKKAKKVLSVFEDPKNWVEQEDVIFEWIINVVDVITRGKEEIVCYSNCTVAEIAKTFQLASNRKEEVNLFQFDLTRGKFHFLEPKVTLMGTVPNKTTVFAYPGTKEMLAETLRSYDEVRTPVRNPANCPRGNPGRARKSYSHFASPRSPIQCSSPRKRKHS